VTLQHQLSDLETRVVGPTVATPAIRTSPAAGNASKFPRLAVGYHPGWSARLWGWLARWRSPSQTSGDHGEFPPTVSGQADGKVRGLTRHRPHDEILGMTKRLISEDRYAFVLLKDAIEQISDRDAQPAWNLLRQQMALIPAGNVPVVLCDGSNACAEVGGFCLDRHAVSNRQFQRFVQAGGYESLEIWPQEVWPSVSRFTDRMGRPGPRDWEDGKFPAGLADHPVVGICWYEAVAFASWVGKRLPTAAEWQKAGGWPEQFSGGDCNRYPWGDLFDPERTNLLPSKIGRPVRVDAFPNGATPNGIFQMTGNVWEWLDDPLETIPCTDGETFDPWKPMRRIMGGAFNTYFPSEATCRFITGQGQLDRLDNIGFRCAVSLDRLRPLP
jgi:iron(II)-dependent oxidoreductase